MNRLKPLFTAPLHGNCTENFLRGMNDEMPATSNSAPQAIETPAATLDETQS